jgi:hypothetical protein
MKWMPLKLALPGLACVAMLCAQTPGERELSLAQAKLEELRSEVAAGVIPRAKLDEAEESLLDGRDAELLSRTLYGRELNEEQSVEMEAAALRRLNRRTAVVDKLRRLVEIGAVSQNSLDRPNEELKWAREEYALMVSRSELVHELAEQARVEQQAMEAQESSKPSIGGPVMERYDGGGVFTKEDLKRVVLAFERQFDKPLPISAQGETTFHRALGFDHRDRVDVALVPDAPDGIWLRQYLEANNIPYYAFRNFVPGKASAAHIHIGPPSNRLVKSD